MMALVPVTGTMFASVEFKGEGRSAVRCCGLFSCLQLVPPAWGPAGKRRGPPSVGMPLLADAPTRLKGMRAALQSAARLPSAAGRPRRGAGRSFAWLGAAAPWPFPLPGCRRPAGCASRPSVGASSPPSGRGWALRAGPVSPVPASAPGRGGPWPPRCGRLQPPPIQGGGAPATRRAPPGRPARGGRRANLSARRVFSWCCVPAPARGRIAAPALPPPGARARRRGRRRKMPARRPFAPVQWCAAARGLVFRPLRRAVAAAGKEKAGLAAGFPGKRKIRTPFSCR